MWRYTYNLRGLYETPTLAQPSEQDEFFREQAVMLSIDAARREGRSLLDEFESKELLAAYGIPTTRTLVARTAEEAVESAAKIGYPIVLKLYSRTITHKTDVGGVKLGIVDADGVWGAWSSIKESTSAKAGAEHFQGVTVQPMVKVADAYEIILGSSLDPQFGPVLLFGSGGQLVEVYKDRALGLPPLNATLARRMIEQTKIYAALRGVRGRKPVDLAALEQLLVRFSQLVVEQRWIKEIDINPLLVSSEQIIALDARVVLHEPSVTEDQIPKLAIRPYPSKYVTHTKTKDGIPVTLRPIRPEDEPLLVRFHQKLSERSVRLRYFSAFKLDQRTTHERLTRVAFIDYDREMAIVAEHSDEKSGEREILGVARLSRVPGRAEAEFAMLLRDDWQNRGLGSQMLRILLAVARGEKLARVTADILPENLEMQRVSQKLGFKLDRSLEEPLVTASIELV
jgi:acetyltransferase